MSRKMSLRNKISDSFDLPKDIVLDMPTIRITGNNEINIENHKGIVEYSSEVLRMNSMIGIIKIVGLRLQIREISQEEVLLTGIISSIEFIN